MRNAAAAEWVLSLVSDHAASTVGDLVEEASSRGVLWFWSSVLRTAGSHCWRDLSASPLGMVGLAFWGLVASVLAGVGAAMPLMIARSIIGYSIPPWEEPLVMVLMWTAGPLVAGWAVARRSNGRELPAAFAVVVLMAVLYVSELYRMGVPYPSMQHAFTEYCARALFFTAGAILYRRRTLARRQTQTSSPRPGS